MGYHFVTTFDASFNPFTLTVASDGKIKNSSFYTKNKISANPGAKKSSFAPIHKNVHV